MPIKPDSGSKWVGRRMQNGAPSSLFIPFASRRDIVMAEETSPVNAFLTVPGRKKPRTTPGAMKPRLVA